MSIILCGLREFTGTIYAGSSKSHPFFTGEEKIIDTEGRVDRFKARQAAAEARRAALANKAKKKSAKNDAKAEKSAAKKQDFAKAA